MSEPFFITHLHKANYLLINQFREIDFINIVFSLTYEHYEFVRFFDECANVLQTPFHNHYHKIEVGYV